MQGHSEGHFSGVGPGHVVVFDELSEPMHGEVKPAPAFTHDTVIVDLAAAEERIMTLAALDGVVYDGIHNMINAAPLPDIYSEPFTDPAKEEIARRFQEANGGTMRDARKLTMHADNYSFKGWGKGWDNAHGRDYSSARWFTQFWRYSEADIEFTHRMHSHADALREHENTIELTPGKDYRPGESRERPAITHQPVDETKAGYIRMLKQHGYQWVEDALSINIYESTDKPPVISITRAEWDAVE